MSIDKKIGNKPAAFSRPDLTSIKIDPGTYIGIVKRNDDPDRKGRLMVWIPDLGGDPNDDYYWRNVSYASPFFGSTYYEEDSRSRETTFNTVNHTYGMWFVPPDLNSQVLVTFIAGRPDKGYWFACISPHASHNMIPALAASTKWQDSAVKNELPANIQNQTVDNNLYPVLEFNENDPDLRRPGFQTNNPRPLHRKQFERLVEQGLENDAVRGTTTSSSQREAPSNVFGFSTPGRPDPDPRDNAELLQRINDRTAEQTDFQVKKRQGGHVFVMDDGTLEGNDQQIRLRTAGGHQIVMHDSGQTLYISNSNGSVWLEMSNSGQLHVFSSNGINLRTQGDFNIHTDRDLNLNVGGSLNLKSVGNFRVESQQIDLSSETTTKIYAANIEQLANQEVKIQGQSDVLLNSGSPISVPAEIPIRELNETKLNPASQTWQSVEKALTSIVSIAPTHEPFVRKAGTTVTSSRSANTSSNSSGVAAQPAADGSNIDDQEINIPELTAIECEAGTLRTTSGGQVVDGSGNPVGAGSAALDAGPSAAQGRPIKTKLPKNKLVEQPVPIGGLGPLSAGEVRALMAQIGWKESSWNYAAVNTVGYVGKYQFGAAALVDRGYIHPDYYTKHKNAALTIDNAWTGKNNINSRDNWLANPSVQERTMYEQLAANYQQMTRNGAIKAGDDKCTIAGMLGVAHLLGPNRGTTARAGALGWRQTGTGADGYGTSGTDYYNFGRYAIDVLTKEV